MKITPFKTHVIQPGESILKIIDTYLPTIEEGDIVVLTSKILSVCERRIVPKEEVNKLDLIKQEAEAFLEDDISNKYQICLTIKNGFLIPTAGIDESNCQNGYILYPQDVQKSTVEIWKHLRHHVKECGVLITDSRTSPMRRGVTGIGIGWCGFRPFFSYIGNPDIFGRPLKVTVTNILDALATSAVFVMGEGDEQTPLAVIKNAPNLAFVDREPTQDEVNSVTIPIEDDLYAPLLTSVNWIRR